MKMGWRTSRLSLIGVLAVILLFLGIGVWGTQATLAGAVIASGQIVVEARRQVVQHPDGGVVREILARDGDLVKAGAPLLRLDDVAARSERVIVQGQLAELRARATRLQAERDGRETVVFDQILAVPFEDEIDLAEIVRGQGNLFEARKTSQKEAVQSFREQQAQIENEILGQDVQVKSLEDQLVLIESELADQQSLLEKGLTQASRVLSLRRERARLEGQRGETTAAIARNKGRIAQIDIEILRLRSARREEAVTELRDVLIREAELKERDNGLSETLSRLDLRAPMDGMVHGMQIHALNAVIRPADPVLYIVPQTQEMVISARVDAQHVDSVHIGQEAVLRFAAFEARTTPELFGVVQQLSPDVLSDERTGQQYYNADIVPKPGEIERLNGLMLVPGMPVEAFIQTGERSPLSYLLKPFTDYFVKAFRE